MNLASDNKNKIHPNFKEMVAGAEKALKSVLGFSKGESVLIILDDERTTIGEAFMKGAENLGANKTHMYSLSQHQRPILDIPEDLINMFVDYNVIINTFKSDTSETPFRVKLVYEEISNEVRVGHAPGITNEMMYEGPMNVDYQKIGEDANKLMALFENAKEVHITSPDGTDITLGIEGRLFSTDVKISLRSFGNLPAGEVWCAPIEDQANGEIVVDGTIGDIGFVKQPLYMTVKDGKIKNIESDDEEMVELIKRLVNVDKMASIIGELGIGLNPNAKLTGNLLEDEKAGKTTHIAFGNNMEMVNGCNQSATHRDFLFLNPSMVVTYTDGSKKKIIDAGIVL